MPPPKKIKHHHALLFSSNDGLLHLLINLMKDKQTKNNFLYVSCIQRIILLLCGIKIVCDSEVKVVDY